MVINMTQAQAQIESETKQVFLDLAKIMIENKAPYIDFDNALREFVENIDEIKKIIESKGWVVFEEKYEFGGYWIIPKELEKYIHGLVMATLYHDLDISDVNKVLTQIYSNTREGEAAIIAEFIEKFNIPHEIANEEWTKEYTGSYDIVIDKEHVIHAHVYYCNVLSDEWGMPYAHGVFKCTKYTFR